MTIQTWYAVLYSIDIYNVSHLQGQNLAEDSFWRFVCET